MFAVPILPCAKFSLLQYFDYQNDSMDSFLKYLGSEPSGNMSEMLSSRIVPSFLSCVKRHSFDTVDDSSLRIWFISMMLRGMKFTQARRYLVSLHTLYLKWRSSAELPDPFAGLLADLQGQDFPAAGAPAGASEALKRLTAKFNNSQASTALCAFFYLLYNPAAGVADAIRLRIDSQRPDCDQIDEIIDRAPRKPRAIYAFQLNQGNTTDRHIEQRLLQEIQDLLRSVGIDFPRPFSRDLITALWIAAALESGISLQNIRNTIGVVPPEYAALRLLQAEEISETDKHRIIATVAAHINDTSPKWHIMRLRRGVDAHTICRVAKEAGDDIGKEITFYNPTYTEIRLGKNGKKITVEVPFIPGILFFKYRSNKIPQLFRHIGQYAWCYRQTNTPDAPYSSLTNSQMVTFQRHIGYFTADIKAQLLPGSAPLVPGTQVLINGGSHMAGHIGQITSVQNADGTRTYSLVITESMAMRWTVDALEEIYLTPLNTQG